LTEAFKKTKTIRFLFLMLTIENTMGIITA